MKSWVVIIGAAGFGAGLLAAGCDDKPTVPQAIIDQAAQATTQTKSKKPTTQELLEGRRSRTALIPLPLTMDLPPGWGKFDDLNDASLKVASAGLNLLQGHTPHGEVQIQLTNRPAMKQDELDRVVSAGKKEQAEKPRQIVRFELRPLGNVRVLERQSVGQPAPLTVYDSKNQPHTTTESPFSWTVTVLVPNEGAFQRYELNFIGLTKSQYDQDKKFLEDVLRTLAYPGDTASSPAGAAPSAATPGSLPDLPSAPIPSSVSPASTLPGSSGRPSAPEPVPTGVFGNTPPTTRPLTR